MRKVVAWQPFISSLLHLPSHGPYTSTDIVDLEARSDNAVFTVTDLLFVDQLLLFHVLFERYFSTMIIEL